MNALYSLYDALVSIEVPPEKARAVVDAMERDMTTLLTTKADLASTQLLLKRDIAANQALLQQELVSVRYSLKQEIASVRDLLRQEIVSVRDSLAREISVLRDSVHQEFGLLRRDMELLRSSMTIRLGTMLFVAMGLLFTALKLT